ncbi:hypothetical protein BDK51DRAFT_36684 [Blyttiomyces helicus]|uniref:Ketopantoate reductase N-terminal domain-containing protein n=1 Tax=Blyttiomyces helicus TaxID=388810 RepID=A0A4P9W0H4_9FUNG|nr:hypothetical protein BDK51DRAFT_36684 [Blyttiomyces helicus]|eukprot:RKO84178.1 hypothetical protein BDK51DRAFT_36684 [Blyttiomyces helicus]
MTSVAGLKLLVVGAGAVGTSRTGAERGPKWAEACTGWSAAAVKTEDGHTGGKRTGCMRALTCDDPHPSPTALLLSAAGANVSYLLRPKYVPALKSHPLRLFRVPILPFFSSPKTVLFTPDAVYSETDVEEKKLPRDFDMVIVTVPEDTIRNGKWLKNLMLAAPDAVLVGVLGWRL